MAGNLGPQFKQHPAGGYQLPLPGMTRPELGVSRHTDGWESGDALHVSHIFKHPEGDLSHYSGLSPAQFRRVKTANIKPTQPVVHEDYLNEKSKSPEHPEVTPDGKRGQYSLVDGHHRVARALLRGQKTIGVQVYGAHNA